MDAVLLYVTYYFIMSIVPDEDTAIVDFLSMRDVVVVVDRYVCLSR